MFFDFIQIENMEIVKISHCFSKFSNFAKFYKIQSLDCCHNIYQNNFCILSQHINGFVIRINFIKTTKYQSTNQYFHYIYFNIIHLIILWKIKEENS
jgi:plasmid replication initiation protein